jgi:hypothetical protein
MPTVVCAGLYNGDSGLNDHWLRSRGGIASPCFGCSTSLMLKRCSCMQGRAERVCD